jgi:metal-responsive CopG/Arc/MetJ family transcriptional regulator
MNSDFERLNIILPKELVKQINILAGPRKRSAFITMSIRLLIEQKQKEERDKYLEEGYRAHKQESLDLAKEFEFLDLEAWDDY